MFFTGWRAEALLGDTVSGCTEGHTPLTPWLASLLVRAFLPWDVYTDASVTGAKGQHGPTFRALYLELPSTEIKMQ